MKNKKPVVALGALAVVGLIAGTFAYFTSTVDFDNVFTTAVYKTVSTEVFQAPSNWTPGETIDKTLTTKNEGSIPVAVRVKAVESWVNEDGETIDPQQLLTVSNYITGTNKNIAIINLANTNDWTSVADNDGTYYYYKTSLLPDATTSSFIESVTLNPNLPISDEPCVTTTPSAGTTVKTCERVIQGLGKATYTLTLTVETVQFDHYADVWTGAPTITAATASTGTGD